MGQVTPIRSRKAAETVARTPAPTIDNVPEPEDVLRQLFRQEARLEAELRDVRFRMTLVRPIYARKHHLMMLPGIDQLRRLFSLC